MEALKTKIMALAGLIFLLLIASAFVRENAGEAEKSKNTCLLLSGIVKGKDNKESIKIRLVESGATVDSISVHSNQDFSFNLCRNKQYSVTINWPGHFPQLVCISTYLPDHMDEHFQNKFHFSVSPESKTRVNAEVADVLDFPVAVICYDTVQKAFNYSERYTRFIQEAYKKVNK